MPTRTNQPAAAAEPVGMRAAAAIAQIRDIAGHGPHG